MIDDLQRYADAIAMIESGGRYGSLGPTTKTGDRAYGKYQVMGSNVGPWTRDVLGRAESPAEFLRDTRAQDAVFRAKFGASLQKYGNPDDASSIWFSGRPVSQAGNSSDGYNTVSQYLKKFHSALGDGDTTSPMAMAFAGQGGSVADKANSIFGPAMSGGGGAAPTGGLLSMLQGQSVPDNGLGKMLGLGNLGSVLGKIGQGMVTAANPMAGASMQNASAIRAMAMMPELKQIGQDMFGRPIMGWANKFNQTVTPMSVGGGSAAAGVPGGAPGANSASGNPSSPEASLAQIRAAAQTGKYTKEQLIAMAPPEIQGDLTDALSYRAIPTSLSSRGPMRNGVIAYLHTIDPTYDETQLPARVDFMKKAANSSINTSFGGQRSALGTALDHFSKVSDAAVGVHNPNGPDLLSAIPGGDYVMGGINAVKNSSVENAPAKKAVMNTAQKAAGEVMKLYSGNQGGGVHERDRVLNNYNPNQTSKSFAANLASDLGLMQGKQGEIAFQRDNIMGADGATKLPIMSPQAQHAVARIKANILKLDPTYDLTGIYDDIPPLGAKGSAAAPKSSAAPAAAASIKDGATATGPNGHKIVSKGGQWFDAQTGQPLQ
jgi:hypothetical protein